MHLSSNFELQSTPTKSTHKNCIMSSVSSSSTLSSLSSAQFDDLPRFSPFLDTTPSPPASTQDDSSALSPRSPSPVQTPSTFSSIENFRPVQRQHHSYVSHHGDEVMHEGRQKWQCRHCMIDYHCNFSELWLTRLNRLSAVCSIIFGISNSAS